jgi:hypothetical protein
VARPVHRIDEEDVGPAIVVVVDDADSAPHGLWQKLGAERATVVLEMDAGLLGYIRKRNGSRRTRRCRVCNTALIRFWRRLRFAVALYRASKR